MSRDAGAEITAIHGHPQLLAHCRAWLSQRYPGAQLVEAPTSSSAAARAQGDASLAALGTPLSAELHGLKVLAHSPKDYSSQARFIILGRRTGAPSGTDNTMLMVHASDKIGALLEVLQIFARHGVNVRQIENRPVPGDPTGAQVRFFLEVGGHHEDSALREATAELVTQGSSVKVLGSYPAPTWVEER